MKILGINISHDPSIAHITDDKIDYVHDEPRFRRDKWWTPEPRNYQYLSIPRSLVEQPDHIVIATFDRRHYGVFVDGEMVFDRKVGDELMEFSKDNIWNRENIDKIVEKHSSYMEIEEDVEGDKHIATGICVDQLATNYFSMDFEHHLYHAYCGHALSPWKDETVIGIVWDGGGAQRHYDSHPNFQEMETIYRCEPSSVPQLQYQRLSNHRFCTEFSGAFPNMPWDMMFTTKSESKIEKNGAEVFFDSRPSMGMNFSMLSKHFGADPEGRGAGKIMGMASYGRNLFKGYNNYDVAQRLELESYDEYVKIIKDAIKRNPDVNKIVLSGGFSLNCTNNYKYLSEFPDHEFFVDPIPHDGGTALGACLHKRITL
tara:strand:+ start:881 stop:1993 length:1113 start_codon:yes stop_codon:yes gene_type:complete